MSCTSIIILHAGNKIDFAKHYFCNVGLSAVLEVYSRSNSRVNEDHLNVLS